jgi:hypothetical protein
LFGSPCIPGCPVRLRKEDAMPQFILVRSALNHFSRFP